MLPKFRSTFRKGWKGASVKADIWHGESIDHALNNEFHWGHLHGEIGLLEIQILLLHISVLKLLESKIRIVQKGSTHPFYPPELFDECFYSITKMERLSFGLLKIYLTTLDADKMRGKAEKSIWNIWTKIKWEAKFWNPNWPLSMGLNQ